MDHIYSSEQINSYNFYDFHLSAELVESLHQLSESKKIQISDILLIVWIYLLYVYTEKEELNIEFSYDKQRESLSCKNNRKLLPLTITLKKDQLLLTDLIKLLNISLKTSELNLPDRDRYIDDNYPYKIACVCFEPEEQDFHEYNLLKKGQREEDSSNSDLILNIGINLQNKLSPQTYLTYKSHLFKPKDIDRLMGHYQVLLEQIVKYPQQPLSSFPLLTEQEKQQILVEWNDTEADYPKDKFIHQLFEEQVVKTPNAIAVVFETKQLTYKELNDQANQLAYQLQKLGVKPEVLVGICLQRSCEMVIALLGVLKAGGDYLPLDPSYSPERLDYMLENAEVSVLISERSLLKSLPEYPPEIITLDQKQDSLGQDNSLDNPTLLLKPENLAYVIYTSGSTGKPKGVQIEHRSDG